MRGGEVLADLDWRALAAAARTEVVGRAFDRNRTMILRELHIRERKSAVACVDARDESVMGHIRFSSASLKDSCLNARGKSKAGNSAGNSQRFSKVSSLDSSNGGADGIRTHDLLDAIEARSQLRHGPTVKRVQF